MPPELLLYSTSHCHLCEIALDLLNDLGLAHDLNIIEIVDNDTLEERYGLLIPVLQRSDTLAELHWPFDKVAILQFLST